MSKLTPLYISTLTIDTTSAINDSIENVKYVCFIHISSVGRYNRKATILPNKNPIEIIIECILILLYKINLVAYF